MYFALSSAKRKRFNTLIIKCGETIRFNDFETHKFSTLRFTFVFLHNEFLTIRKKCVVAVVENTLFARKIENWSKQNIQMR